MSKLHFRYAAMSAGKTTQLLQIRHNYKSLGRTVMLLTAAVDDRFGVGKISSRLGIDAEADVFRPETDMFALVEQYRASVTDAELGAVLIDEAQFLTVDQVKQLHRAVHTLHVPVLCFGLRSDFQGNAFPGAAMLLTLAEDIEELKNVCSCGSKATMNMRVDANGDRVRAGPQVLIGDATYRQVCAKCFYAPEASKYLACESWEHIFEDIGARTVRFVIDTTEKKLVYMGQATFFGWTDGAELTPQRIADVVDSLLTANDACFDSPADFGMTTLSQIPKWAHAA